MANNHGVVNTTHCTCWDVDAYKAVGVAQVDLDNGVLVTLGDINKNADNAVQGYEFNVTAAEAASTHVWLVRTPEVGATLDMQMYSDPRHFYNVAGRPMSLCYLHPHVDCIEVDANCFVEGSAPADQPTYTFATIGEGGKYAMAEAAPDAGTYFSLVGTHTMSIGMEVIPTYILRCENN